MTPDRGTICIDLDGEGSCCIVSDTISDSTSESICPHQLSSIKATALRWHGYLDVAAPCYAYQVCRESADGRVRKDSLYWDNPTSPERKTYLSVPIYLPGK
jgi:hypothetical protein